MPGLLPALLHRDVALGSFRPCGIFDNDAKQFPLALTYKENIYLEYRFDDVELFGLMDDRILLKTSLRLEELVDRALTIIENKEW